MFGFNASDKTLNAIVRMLQSKFGCHTGLLYGSRARGNPTSISDYDVVGIRQSGKKTRLAKKVDGAYWDIFVFAERDLKKLSNEHLSWRDAKVLFEKRGYGRKLVSKIQKLVNSPFKPAPKFEIDVTRAWSDKQIERIKAGDIHGLYRRTELQAAAIADYFQIRRKRYWGPKDSLNWLKENDPTTFRLFERVYKNPGDLRALKVLITRVYKN